MAALQPPILAPEVEMSVQHDHPHVFIKLAGSPHAPHRHGVLPTHHDGNLPCLHVPLCLCVHQREHIIHTPVAL